jgi:hypothetical protein
VESHGGRDGQWIRCDPTGHCQWIASTPVAAARVRIYEASRGPVPRAAYVESTCGNARCVNLDHLRLVAGRALPSGSRNPLLCQRGHELTRANVVRHRDGRIAYCRTCRNDRRRERYRTDPAFTERELQRQRRIRARANRPGASKS